MSNHIGGQAAAPEIRAHDGSAIAVRQLQPRDRILVAELLCKLSDRTWRLRYMTPRPQSAEAIATETERIAGGHPARHVTLLAVAQSAHREHIVAIAEMVCDQDGHSGELAVLVGDEEQRRGIGRMLLRRLVAIARERGVASLTIDTLTENQGMMALIHAVGAPHTLNRSYGEVRAIVNLSREGDTMPAA